MRDIRATNPPNANIRPIDRPIRNETRNRTEITNDTSSVAKLNGFDS